MKIAIFHPQIKTFGGGELISLSIASLLSKDHNVDLYSPYHINIEELEKFFNIKLRNLKLRNLGRICTLVTKSPTFGTYKMAFYVRKMLKIKGYDLIIDTGTNGMF